MSTKNKKKNPKKKKRIAAVDVTTIPNQIKKARSYPISHCYITSDWKEGGACNIYLLRQRPDSMYVLGGYLIDLYCLGLKNTLYQTEITYGEIEDRMLNNPNEKIIEIDIDKAHSIIYGGIDYAENLGFAPHKDFKCSKYILKPREEVTFDDSIEFGNEGKPFYISGPYDSEEKINRILRHLEERVGKDNFYYLTRADDLM